MTLKGAYHLPPYYADHFTEFVISRNFWGCLLRRHDKEGGGASLREYCLTTAHCTALIKLGGVGHFVSAKTSGHVAFVDPTKWIVGPLRVPSRGKRMEENIFSPETLLLFGHPEEARDLLKFSESTITSCQSWRCGRDDSLTFINIIESLVNLLLKPVRIFS